MAGGPVYQEERMNRPTAASNRWPASRIGTPCFCALVGETKDERDEEIRTLSFTCRWHSLVIFERLRIFNSVDRRMARSVISG